MQHVEIQDILRSGWRTKSSGRTVAPDATSLVLYDRRRVGKARLLRQWIKKSQARALYWMAEPSSVADQLRSFSETLYNFVNPNAPAPPDFSYVAWAQAGQSLSFAPISRKDKRDCV
jgi:hypothetical protein